MTEINQKTLDEKRQKKRKESWIYKVVEDSKKEKFYILDMFPYPSGAGLHVWHPKWFMASDTIARKKMLQWYNVLHPMWFDTFWLWTENYAIEHKMKPQDVAKQNIENYIKQLEMFGTTYDRDRVVNTADPKYFKWTQRVFLKMYNHYFDEKLNKAMPITDPATQQRLAYVDYKAINRCPSCMTGLANEDLDDGKCERCASQVEQKPMKQWVLRITKYAQRLIDWLDKLNREESMKDLERNRIWKSEGTQFKMNIQDSDKFFEVYTTRIDTVFGVSFVVMAPEHPLVDQITTDEFKEGVEKYKEEAKHKTQLERTELQKDKNWQFTWTYAINPFNNQQVPIYIADYVLANYGTWVVMAVPAHDERDFEFAKKYNITIKQVIVPKNIMKAVVVVPTLDNEQTFKKELEKNNINFTLAISTISNREHIRAELTKGNIETFTKLVQQHIKENCWVEVLWSENMIILKNEIHKNFLAESEKWFKKFMEREPLIKGQTNFWNMLSKNSFLNELVCYTNLGFLVDSWDFTWLSSDEAITQMQSRLEKNNLWWKKINYKMQDRVFSRQRYRWEPFPIVWTPDWKAIALEESDLPLTLPDVENYAPTGTVEWPLAAIEDRVNVTLKDWTQAKRETNTMPGRAGSSRYRLRYMDPNNENALVWKDQDAYRKNVDVYIWWAEHVTRHMIYARFWQKFLFDLWIVSQDEPFQEYHYVWLIMWEDGRKMSKRRWNVVNPDEIINEFWADTLRTYEMFMWPFDQAIARSTNGIKWVKKFLDKIVVLKDKIDNATIVEWKTITLLHQTIKKLTEDIDWFRFNTAVSQLMILVNHLTELEKIDRKTFETLVILVSPFAPHTTEELREQIWNEYSIFTKAKWPTYEEKYLVSDEVTLAVQINWKMRWTILINKDADQNQAFELIKNDEKISSYIIWEPKKIIYVQGKILNIIL